MKRADGQSGGAKRNEYGLTIDAAECIAIEVNNGQTKYGICFYIRYGLGALYNWVGELLLIRLLHIPVIPDALG